MARIRQTDEQQEGLRFISLTLRELEKLRTVLRAEPEISAKGTADGKVCTVRLDLGAARSRKLIRDYGQTLSAAVEARAAKFCIELEKEEKDLCSFFEKKQGNAENGCTDTEEPAEGPAVPAG